MGGPNLTAVLPSHRCACHRHANVKQSDVIKLARQIEYVAARPAHGMGGADANADPALSDPDIPAEAKAEGEVLPPSK